MSFRKSCCSSRAKGLRSQNVRMIQGAPLGLGRPFLAPPGISADRLAALRAAIMRRPTTRSSVSIAGSSIWSVAALRRASRSTAMIKQAYATPEHVHRGRNLSSVQACRRSSEPQVVTVQLVDGPAAHQLHVAFDFGSEIFKRPFNAGLTRGRQSIQIKSPSRTSSRMGAVPWARRQRSVSHPRSSRRGLFCVERQASYVRIRGAASVLRDLVFRYQLSYIARFYRAYLD